MLVNASVSLVHDDEVARVPGALTPSRSEFHLAQVQ